MKSVLFLSLHILICTVSAQTQIGSKNSRQEDAINFTHLLLNYPSMAIAEHQEEFDIVPDLDRYLTYQQVADSAATISVRNRMNHLVYIIRVSFDSIRMKRMMVYLPVRQPNFPDIKNAKWKHGLAYMFTFNYNEEGKLVQVRSANKGRADLVHSLREYSIFTSGDRPDSVVGFDNLQRTISVGYFNGYARPDSIYFFSYTIPDGNVLLDRKELYLNTSQRERTKLAPLPMGRMERARVVSDEKGRLFTAEKYITNREGQQLDSKVTTYSYNQLDRLAGAKSWYRSGTPTLASDTSQSSITPHISRFTLNDKGQVVQEHISYLDNCVETDEFITYTLSDDGAVRETRSVRKVKVKCK
ncbi:MAG: hypothetical protein H7Y42_17195 [Chitinophagaceae bacterium]|nr:hypothetical protein [Chitinophagaceae bacterium]